MGSNQKATSLFYPADTSDDFPEAVLNRDCTNYMEILLCPSGVSLMQSPSHSSGQHEAELGDISPVIAWLKGGQMLPDSLAAHAKCFVSGKLSHGGCSLIYLLFFFIWWHIESLGVLQHMGCSVLSRVSPELKSWLQVFAKAETNARMRR